jgi:hypothetical protein
MIVEHVNCQLKRGLLWSAKQWELPWLTSQNAGTSVTLTFTALQQSGINAGALLTNPFRNGLRVFPAANGGNVTVGQSFSLGVGGTAAANASQTQTIQYTVRNSDIVNSERFPNGECPQLENGVQINSNLKIAEFIYANAELAYLNNVNSALKSPVKLDPRYRSIRDVPVFNTFTNDVNFVAAFGGSVNPTWKLMDITTNSPGTLLGVENTYTNDLVVTVGQLANNAVPFQLDSAGAAQHQNRVAANAIATSIQGQSH